MLITNTQKTRVRDALIESISNSTKRGKFSSGRSVERRDQFSQGNRN